MPTLMEQVLSRAKRAPQFKALSVDVPVVEAVIEDFQGFASKTEERLVNPQYGFLARNLRFSKTAGAMEKRASRAKFGGMSTLGTSRVMHASRYYKSSSAGKKLVIAYSTTLKVGDDSAGTFASIKTGLTADLQYRSLTYKNLLYLFNGTDASQVFDLAQSVTESVGVPTPGALTAAIGSATGITGTFLYKVTYEIDSYQEGNAGVASNSVTVANEKVNLSGIPVSANTRVTARNIYRTQTGGAIYYFHSRIANNTDTTLVDTTADASLTTTRTAPSDYGAPDQNYKHACLHKERVFQFRGETDQSKLIWSDIRSGAAYPDVYPALNSAFVTRDDGEEGCFVGEDQFGQLIAMKANAVVLIDTTADSPTGWTGFNHVRSRDGVICPWSVAKTPTGLLYVGGYGEGRRRLLLWNGSKVETVFPELEPLLSEAARSQNDNFVAEYHEGFYHLAFPRTGETANSVELIIDLEKGTWTTDDKAIQCYSSWSRRNDFGELYTGTADATGFVYREDTSVEDVLVQTLTELDEGTFSQCESTGTEQAPKLTLIQSELADDVGADLISAASQTISDLTTNPTSSIAPSGLYTSRVFEVNASDLGSIFWNEQLGSRGEIVTRVRTGDTLAAIAAAAYSDDFSTPGGSSLSALTPRKYVQFQCQLYVTQADEAVSEAPNVYVERGTAPSDYLFKITLGQGELAESAIEMEYESAWLDFGWIDARLKNRRKRLRWAKVEFVRTVASGTLTFGWRKDYETDASRRDQDFSLATYASKGFFVYRFPIVGSDAGTCKVMKYRLYHNDDTSPLRITKVTLCFQALPATTLF